MGEDGAVVIASGAHNGGAYLAEAYAMTPAGASEGETVGIALNHEGRAVQVALA